MNFETLLSSPQVSSVRPELLEMIGQQASQMFLEKGTPLNQAIVSLAGQHNNLDTEHLRRIVEFANNNVFLHMHANAADKVVDFDVADPGIVLRDLRDGGSPAQDGKTMNLRNKDYLGPPQQGMQKQDQFSDLDSALTNLSVRNNSNGIMGHGEAVEKNASVHFEDHLHHANPVDDIFDLYTSQEGVRSNLAEAHEAADQMVKQAQEEFYNAVKQEVLNPDGAGLGGAVSVVERMAPPDVAQAMMGPVSRRLVTEEVASLPELEASLRKSPGRIINPNHPLVQSASGLLKAANDKIQLETALKQTCDSVDDLEKTLMGWVR